MNLVLAQRFRSFWKKVLHIELMRNQPHLSPWSINYQKEIYFIDLHVCRRCDYHYQSDRMN